MTYLNVVEVESALAALAAAYPALTDLITLPNKTVEGRTSHALRIGKTPTADSVVFAACAHAREWGGADICVYFAADLLAAYTSGTGLGYGGKWFSATSIGRIVELVNVVIFPCVNPDGRAFDQQFDALWRKNRNPASSGGDPNRIGVDINRNHSFLWDFRTTFDPAASASGSLASDDPGNDLFHGMAADSEAETGNIHWLLDKFRFTRWYVDIHSFDGDLLFSWGDDLDQSDDPGMNFLNSAYDGQRGRTGGYGEYIPSSDLTTAQGTAQRVVDAINAVRGSGYTAEQSVSLWGVPGSVSYPTSGASDDYAFSRHWANCAKRKIYGFTLEFGFNTGNSRTSFHPPWSQMSQIVSDIDAGMVELCLAAAPRWIPPWIAAYRRLFPWQIWDPMAQAIAPTVRPVVNWIQQNVLGG